MAKQRLLADSSVLVALYNPKDNQHLKAKKLLQSLPAKETEVFIHSLIILEILTVLKQKTSRQTIREAKKCLFDPTLYALLKDKFFLEPDDFIFRIFEENKNLSLVDAKLLEICLLKNLILLTLDRNLKSAAKKYKISTF